MDRKVRKILSNAAQNAAFLRQGLFSAFCPGCGKLHLHKTEVWYGLCAECQERFLFQIERRCEKCGRPLISEQGRCMECRRAEPDSVDRSILIYPYIGIYQEILTAYKFGANRALARFYAEKMLIALAMLGEFSMENAGWVPVPPKPGKIKAKGWDQIETLAAALVSSPDNTLYMRRCLRRLASQSQKKLDAAGRKINLQGKIRCVKKPPTTAILFDDVHTTGATIQTCAQALKAAGSQTVLALCLYYA